MFRTIVTMDHEVRSRQAQLLEQAATQRCIAELPKAGKRPKWRFWRTYSLRPAPAA